MATSIKTSEKAKRQDTFRVNPADIVPGRNSRMVEAPDYPATVRDRAISIAESGQLQPVEARREKDDTLVLTFGYTRKAAVELLRKGFEFGGKTYHDPEALLWVKVVDCGPDEAFLRGLRENRERKDTTDLQEALAHSELRTTMGWSDAQIAREYGYTNQNRVAALNKLLTLDEKTQQLVHAGKLALYTALDTLKADLTPDERAAVLDGSVRPNGTIDGAVVRKLIRDLLDLKTPDTDVPVIDERTEEAVGPVATGSALDAGPDKVKSVKRTVKEFQSFVAEVADREDGIAPAVKDLIAALGLWFDGKKGFGDRKLWTLLANLKGKGDE